MDFASAVNEMLVGKFVRLPESKWGVLHYGAYLYIHNNSLRFGNCNIPKVKKYDCSPQSSVALQFISLDCWEVVPDTTLYSQRENSYEFCSKC
jgi:hypothetical protein